MNEKEEAQWIFDNMLEIIGDEEKARVASAFLAEQMVYEIVDNAGVAERSQGWQHIYQMLMNNEIK
jgi:hypothetical protein